MKRIIFLLICFSFFSCSKYNTLRKVKFSYFEGIKKNVLFFYIPKKFTVAKIGTGGEGEEHRYSYPDSSVIYISNASGLTSLNEENFKLNEAAYVKSFLSDNVDLDGKDSLGRFWQEIKNGNLIYGFKRVSPKDTAIFRKALRSVKIR